jgi:hypothetical protein
MTRETSSGNQARLGDQFAEFWRGAFYESATLRKRCREIRIEGIGSLVNPVTTEQAMHASRLRERGTQVATHEHGEKHEPAST